MIETNSKLSIAISKMPTLEGLEEAGLEKIPDLSIAKMRFELSLDSTTAKELKIDQAAVSCSIEFTSKLNFYPPI